MNKIDNVIHAEFNSTEQLIYLRQPGAKTAEPRTRPAFKELTAGEILQSEKKETNEVQEPQE